MAEVKKRIPKRRFKEFQNAEEWEQRKLEDIADIIGGGTPSTSNSEYWDGDIDWYAPAEIDEQIYASNSVRKITNLGLKNSSAKILPADKTILFTSRAGIGKTAILSRPSATNQGFQSLVLFDDYNTYFIYSMSSEIKKKAEAVASGSTFLEISGKILGKLNICVPSKPEQEKIGAFFKTLDTLISLHQRKLDKIKSLKKAYLSEMFPVEGESKPKRRFKGFADDWVQRKLGEIYKFQYGQFNNNPSNGGEYPVYGANGVIGGYTEFNAENSVIIGHMGEYAGIVLWNEGKHFVTYNGIITTPKDKKIDSRFGYYMLYKKEIRVICGGSGQPFLSYEMLNKLSCSYPIDFAEQIKISKLFTNIDNLMTLHQQKLDKLKNLKKAYLNEMFV